MLICKFYKRENGLDLGYGHLDLPMLGHTYNWDCRITSSMCTHVHLVMWRKLCMYNNSKLVKSKIHINHKNW